MCGPFMVELAGLEPATSWVRSSREASPSLAVGRHAPQQRPSADRSVVSVFHLSSQLLDQNLTAPPQASVSNAEPVAASAGHPPATPRWVKVSALVLLVLAVLLVVVLIVGGTHGPGRHASQGGDGGQSLLAERTAPAR